MWVQRIMASPGNARDKDDWRLRKRVNRLAQPVVENGR